MEYNLAVTPFDGKCQNLQRSPTHFILAHTASVILQLKKFTLKSRSQSWNTIFAMIPFEGKCQNLQMTRNHF